MEEENGDAIQTRGNWSSRWDYLLSLAGYCVGVGNVWRFPYLCFKNGGGAFLIPYIVMVFVVGMPLFLLESSLGQFSSSGCVTVYNVAPIFRGSGYASLLVSVIATFYYSMIVAYPLVYLVYSITNYHPPWNSCDNEWNTPYCSLRNTSDVVLNGSLVSPADEFFYNKILHVTSGLEDGGDMVWSLVLASFVVNAVVFLCIFKGVKVVGKVVWFTALFPYVMLGVLFVRGVTLPGAWDGILYFIVPDFYKLGKPRVWVDAAVQVFFSLGPGWGTLVTMGSFSKFHHNVLADVVAIPIINAATSIFAGFVVFSVLGFLANQLGTHVADVTTSGIALAFITYPEAIALLPMASLWAALFFIMLFLLGLDSCFVQMEAVVVSIVDAWPYLRPKKEFVALAVCSIVFLGSLMMCGGENGIYVLMLMDQTSVDLTILLTTLLMLVSFIYVYGVGRLFRDLEMMLQQSISYFWFIAWTYITPLALLTLLISYCMERGSPLRFGDYVMPAWAQVVGWIFSLSSVLAIPVYCFIYLISAKGSFTERFMKCISPSSKWGPALESHRAEWLEYCAHHPLPYRYYHPDADCAPAPRHPIPEEVPMKPVDGV